VQSPSQKAAPEHLLVDIFTDLVKLQIQPVLFNNIRELGRHAMRFLDGGYFLLFRSMIASCTLILGEFINGNEVVC
jgi:hypothetical protein